MPQTPWSLASSLPRYTPVSSIDLPHIILSLLPASATKTLLPMFPDAPGNHPIIAENYYTRARDLYNPSWGHRFDRVRTAFYDWPFKYIHSSDSRHELYDLAGDPAETTNLIASDPQRAAHLAKQLADYKTHRHSIRRDLTQAGAPVDIDQYLPRKQRIIGYAE